MNLLMKYKSRLQRSFPEERLSVIIPMETQENPKSALRYPVENLFPIWRNPYPIGTPEARAESLRVIEAARRGEPI